MRRATFIAATAALAYTAAAARAQDEYDPAMGTTATTQRLRVLLGAGPVAPLPGGGFTFRGRAYRGRYYRAPNGEIVNLLSLEEYLYSVVSREMPPSWPAAALAAQAICARSYVLQRSSPRRAYDVVPSELDQVYDGTRGETASSRAAVDATGGMVLRYGGGFAQAEYSSCCGGHTEASSDAWGGTPIPYLEGVVCPYCTASPNYRWKRRIALPQVEASFAAEIAPYGAMTALAVSEADASGRAKMIELRCERGSAFVRGMDFRLRIGARVLPSLLISQIGNASQAGRVRIAGGGLGHGVGLCQWGARGMALEGATPEAIIAFYFPGVTVTHD